MYICYNSPKDGKCRFNPANESIDWAKWSCNPITGCKTECPFCYARDIAERFGNNFPHGFEPTFYPYRLQAPHNTRIPKKHAAEPAYRNVFLCSMADMFGPWVDRNYIDLVLKMVENAPQWNFIILTKFPLRLFDFIFPDNTWIGTTVHKQSCVQQAVEMLQELPAPVRFISCEPLEEDLTFPSLEYIDWLIIGARSKTKNQPAFQPDPAWVDHLVEQARFYGCKIYQKPNLVLPTGVTPIKEYPEILR